jgi:phosphonate transport system permease protein
VKRRVSKLIWWILLGAFALATWGAKFLGFSPAVLKSAFGSLIPQIGKYAHPVWESPARLVSLVLETLAMGALGTLLAVLFAVPATSLAARTVSPNRATFFAARQAMNFVRSMPDPLIALLLVQCLGIGPLPGALALGLHSWGFVGKSLAEKVERLDPKIAEGLHACGASWMQTLRFGIWPSLDREILSDTLYVFDRNLRVAATLGLVGAGGIGVDLMTALRTFHADQASGIILVIMVLILIVDSVSSNLRRRMA